MRYNDRWAYFIVSNVIDLLFLDHRDKELEDRNEKQHLRHHHRNAARNRNKDDGQLSYRMSQKTFLCLIKTIHLSTLYWDTAHLDKQL